MKTFQKLVASAFVLAMLAITPSAAEAQNCSKNPTHPRCGGNGGGNGGNGGTNGGNGGGSPLYFSWMDSDVQEAYDQGLTGAGSHLIILDNFGGATYEGQMDGIAATGSTPESLTTQSLTHGGWTSLQANLVAPGATSVDVDQPGGRGRDRSGVISDHYSSSAALQVVNLSFGLFDPVGTVVDGNYSFGTTIWDSLTDEAWNPTSDAIFVKAAGNQNGLQPNGEVQSGMTIDTGTLDIGLFSEPHVDTLNISLIGAPNAIYVGALDSSGTIADYSTLAGSDATVQGMYVVVRVADEVTGLAGTSFAAPIVSGYAAIIGDKYNETLSVAPNAGELVVDRLLETALTTNISGYSAEIHGVGEACLTCALSPAVIPQ